MRQDLNFAFNCQLLSEVIQNSEFLKNFTYVYQNGDMKIVEFEITSRYKLNNRRKLGSDGQSFDSSTRPLNNVDSRQRHLHLVSHANA